MLGEGFLHSGVGHNAVPSNTLPTPAWSPRGRVVISPSREGQVSDQARRPDRRRALARHRRRPRPRLRDPPLRRRRPRRAAAGHRRRRRVLVRSATQVDAEALAAATRLKVVARAGVGLDNVDVKAATQAGVMVVNAPTSNIVVRRRARRRPAAGHRPQHRTGQRGAQGRRVEALQVHRRRAARQDRRHRRPRPDRRPRRPAAGRLRHEARRLRPLRAARPRRAARRPAAQRSTSCCGRATSSPCTCPRPRRRSA